MFNLFFCFVSFCRSKAQRSTRSALRPSNTIIKTRYSQARLTLMLAAHSSRTVPHKNPKASAVPGDLRFRDETRAFAVGLVTFVFRTRVCYSLSFRRNVGPRYFARPIRVCCVFHRKYNKYNTYLLLQSIPIFGMSRRLNSEVV